VVSYASLSDLVMAKGNDDDDDDDGGDGGGISQLLLSVPVTLADSRKVILEIRDGGLLAPL